MAPDAYYGVDLGWDNSTAVAWCACYNSITYLDSTPDPFTKLMQATRPPKPKYKCYWLTTQHLYKREMAEAPKSPAINIRRYIKPTCRSAI